MNPPEFHRGYFLVWRTDDFLELLRSKPNAFRLLSLIAYRARWREGYSADGLARGEARLGRFDVERELGLTAKEYRLACATLEQGKFVALQKTPHGTVARIVDSRVFSPTAPNEGTPKGTGKDTPRAHEGHTEGHKEEGKNEEGEDRPVQLPKGFPESEADAAKQAAFCGCTEDFARLEWNQAAARSGKDYGGNPITSFRHYLSARWQKERGRQGEAKANQGGGQAAWKRISDLEAELKHLDGLLHAHMDRERNPDKVARREVVRAELAKLKANP